MKAAMNAIERKVEHIQAEIESKNRCLKKYQECLKMLKEIEQESIKGALVIEIEDEERITQVVNLMQKHGCSEVHVKHVVKAGIKGLRHQSQVTNWMDKMISKYKDLCPWVKPEHGRQIYTLNNTSQL